MPASTSFRRGPPGTSSHLRQGAGRRRVWRTASGQAVTLPLIVDVVHIGPGTRRLVWRVEGTVDLVAGEFRLTRVVVEGQISVVHLQRLFRWAIPLDIVRRSVPALLAQGSGPRSWDCSVDGLPDAAEVRTSPRHRRSDGFLEEVAREHLEIGHGYARAIGFQRGVSPRTW